MTSRSLKPTWIERTVFYSLMAVCVAGITYGSSQMLFDHRDQVVSAQKASYEKSVDQLTSRRGHAIGELAAAEDAIADAQKTFDASDGKTLDQTARAALGDLITHDRQLVAVAYEELRQTQPLGQHDPKISFWGPEYTTAAANLDRYVFVSTSHLAPVPAAFTAPTKAVTDAVTAWQKEQARIAAEKAAQEAAARAAAAAQAAANARQSSGSSSHHSGGGSSSSAGGNYNLYVSAYGWQPEIDACRGGVDITAHYGVHTIAEHNTCGGSGFPSRAGTIVTLSGAEGGTYRVIGIVAYLNGHTQTTADLPRGYDLLFQTCINGYSKMSFTALQRIG